MADEVLDLCFSDEEERDLALVMARSTSSEFDHVGRKNTANRNDGGAKVRPTKTKSEAKRSASTKRTKRKLAKSSGADVIELDQSVDDLSVSPARPRNGTAKKRKGQRRVSSSSDVVELVGEASPPPKATRRDQPGGVVSGADFMSDAQINAATSSILRRSEVSTQDYEFERSRLADLAKEHKKRAAEATKHNAQLTLIRARSFLEHYAQKCKNRVANFTASSPPNTKTGRKRSSTSDLPDGNTSTTKAIASTTLKIRFPTAKTEQLTLLSSAPLSVLFDFCDAKLFEHATERAQEGDSEETKGPLAEDVASVLAKNKHKNGSDGFSQLPDRYSYGLQIVGRKPVWIRRPSRSDAVSSSLGNGQGILSGAAPQGARWTIASAGLRSRMVLVVGQPPPLSHKQKTVGSGSSPNNGTPWDAKFELLSQFQRKRGHCRVPDTHPELGMWVVTQRAAYQAAQDRDAGRPLQSRATILPEQVAKLNQLGFTWTTI